VRQAVYEATRGGWRLAAHARASVALAAQGAAAGERAHHVEHSAAPGDDAAILVLREAAAEAASRAPAAAVRWLEVALRLVPAGDAARQIDVRVALSSALRSTGRLQACRTTLLEALELLPADAAEQRVELTSRCAAVEHWLGDHASAHARLERAWDGLDDRSTAAATALQIELSVDGLYELDFAQTLERGREALERARALGDAALITMAASAACLGAAAAGRIEEARAHHATALERLAALSDAELAPRLETLFYLSWAENYLEHYDDAVAHADRGIAVARATGEGRLLVPLMLVKGYPFEMQGRLRDAIELCQAAVESATLSGNDHYLSWAHFELAWAHYFSGQLDDAIAAAQDSMRLDGRLTGGTMPSSGGGPGWVLACARWQAGELEPARELMRSLGPDDLPHKVPVERCFDWEGLALIDLALGHPDAAQDYVRRAEENAEALGLQMPAAVAGRARAAVLLAAGDAAAAAAAAERSARAADGVGALLQGAFSWLLAGRALAAAGDREGAVATLRDAESTLDRLGSVRPRDEARRELRRLGARTERRGRAGEADQGLGALTDREMEIALLATDRRTNRQIAATLFLSDKTIETHMRNIFIKLGVSSRVDVARTVERARRDDERERPHT
jgi:DNA-binding CsgD family transcriptional regulator